MSCFLSATTCSTRLASVHVSAILSQRRPSATPASDRSSRRGHHRLEQARRHRRPSRLNHHLRRLFGRNLLPAPQSFPSRNDGNSAAHRISQRHSSRWVSPYEIVFAIDLDHILKVAPLIQPPTAHAPPTKRRSSCLEDRAAPSHTMLLLSAFNTDIDFARRSSPSSAGGQHIPPPEGSVEASSRAAGVGALFRGPLGEGGRALGKPRDRDNRGGSVRRSLHGWLLSRRVLGRHEASETRTHRPWVFPISSAIPRHLVTTRNRSAGGTSRISLCNSPTMGTWGARQIVQLPHSHTARKKTPRSLSSAFRPLGSSSNT